MPAELRGATRLAVDGAQALTDLVQAMHDAVGVIPTRFGPGLVYSTIRGVTRVVGAGVDRALAALAPLIMPSGVGARERELVVAALNGVLGDYLASTHNPLAIAAGLRRDGRALTLTRDGLAALPASGRVLVLVHGSSASDLTWLRDGHDHGALLERDLGLTAVHARYNSGLHISTNGAALSGLLTRLVAAWPVPVTELHILSHSMGGLVARAACHVAGDAPWLAALRTLIFLGTPHHGAPLERGGNWVDLVLGMTPWTRPLARLGKIRSAGITDLRFGSVVDADWQGRNRFHFGRDPRRPVPLPAHVACYAVAATRLRMSGTPRDSDGLVPVTSALGVDAHRPEMDLGIPAEHQLVVPAADHLDLLSRADVYARLRAWLARAEVSGP